MAAAHLYPEDFKGDLKERSTHPFKSPAPELGLDLAAIQNALYDAKVRHFGKSILLSTVSVAAFLLFIQHSDLKWMLLVFAISIASAAEFSYLEISMSKARETINTILKQPLVLL